MGEERGRVSGLGRATSGGDLIALREEDYNKCQERLPFPSVPSSS